MSQFSLAFRFVELSWRSRTSNRKTLKSRRFRWLSYARIGQRRIAGQEEGQPLPGIEPERRQEGLRDRFGAAEVDRRIVGGIGFAEDPGLVGLVLQSTVIRVRRRSS